MFYNSSSGIQASQRRPSSTNDGYATYIDPTNLFFLGVRVIGFRQLHYIYMQKKLSSLLLSTVQRRWPGDAVVSLFLTMCVRAYVRTIHEVSQHDPGRRVGLTHVFYCRLPAHGDLRFAISGEHPPHPQPPCMPGTVVEARCWLELRPSWL